jgi:hypothetical protein
MQHRTCLIDNNVISDCQNNYAALLVGSRLERGLHLHVWCAPRGWKSSQWRAAQRLLAANFALAVIISAEADLETK